MRPEHYLIDRCHRDVGTLGYDLVKLTPHESKPDLFYSERLGTYSSYMDAVNNMPDKHDDIIYSVYRTS